MCQLVELVGWKDESVLAGKAGCWLVRLVGLCVGLVSWWGWLVCWTVLAMLAFVAS